MHYQPRFFLHFPETMLERNCFGRCGPVSSRNALPSLGLTGSSGNNWYSFFSVCVILLAAIDNRWKEKRHYYHNHCDYRVDSCSSSVCPAFSYYPYCFRTHSGLFYHQNGRYSTDYCPCDCHYRIHPRRNTTLVVYPNSIYLPIPYDHSQSSSFFTVFELCSTSDNRGTYWNVPSHSPCPSARSYYRYEKVGTLHPLTHQPYTKSGSDHPYRRYLPVWTAHPSGTFTGSHLLFSPHDLPSSHHVHPGYYRGGRVFKKPLHYFPDMGYSSRNNACGRDYYILFSLLIGKYTDRSLPVSRIPVASCGGIGWQHHNADKEPSSYEWSHHNPLYPSFTEYISTNCLSGYLFR